MPLTDGLRISLVLILVIETVIELPPTSYVGVVIYLCDCVVCSCRFGCGPRYYAFLIL